MESRWSLWAEALLKSQFVIPDDEVPDPISQPEFNLKDTNLADNSLDGVECTAHNPGSGSVADMCQSQHPS